MGTAKKLAPDEIQRVIWAIRHGKGQELFEASRRVEEALSTPAAADAPESIPRARDVAAAAAREHFREFNALVSKSPPLAEFQSMREHVAKQMEGVHTALDKVPPEPVALTDEQFAGKLNELERFAGNLAVMHHQHMGKAMPDRVYASFTRLRDDVIPALKREIRAALAASQPAPVAEDIQRARIIAANAQRFADDRTHLGSLVYVNDLAWALKVLAAPVEAQAVPDAKALAVAVCRDVAELPDRNSPEDWPEAMLVTANELEEIILSKFVRLNPSSDYGKPYESVAHAAAQGRKEMAYATAVLSGLITDSRCNYIARPGDQCKKCMRVHDGKGAAAPTPSKGEA